MRAEASGPRSEQASSRRALAARPPSISRNLGKGFADRRQRWSGTAHAPKRCPEGDRGCMFRHLSGLSEEANPSSPPTRIIIPTPRAVL